MTLKKNIVLMNNLPRVANLLHGEYDVYIGRQKSGMHFGNPFSSKENSLAGIKVETHSESLECFRDWLYGIAHQDVEPERRQWVLNNIHLLYNKTLGCYCKPKKCHGDIYLEFILDQSNFEW